MGIPPWTTSNNLGILPLTKPISDKDKQVMDSSLWKRCSGFSSVPLYFFKILSLNILLCLLLISPHLVAEPISVPRIDSPPTIDGAVGTAEWSQATRVILDLETTPGENVTPPVETEAFLMEDGETLFVAFIAHETDTSKIRAYYSDHDKIGGHDSVGIVLDTFNDERLAFEFFVNPLGVQRDVINDDVNKRQDGAWDALWESAGKINGSNYTVEIAIPFSQLRFKNGVDQQTWGIDLVRLYPRDKFTRIGANALDRNISCYLCQLQKAEGFDQLQPSLNLIVTPTVTGNASESRDPLTDLDWDSNESNTEAGIDLRWGINQSLYLNATLNPDFSQVEADNAQLDVNTTFSLFFPERRTFFLDGASYFNTRLNIVHTRNIAEPDFGVKLTGKEGAHSYGLLTARDSKTSFILPGNEGSRFASLGDTESDVLIARYRQDIGENHTLGVVVTDRRADEYSNTVVGVDGVFQFGKSDRLSIQALQSESENPLQFQDPVNSFGLADEQSDSAMTIQYSHRARIWDWFANYDNVGEDFRADLGFINRANHYRYNVGGGHTWHLDNFAFSRIRWGGNWEDSFDQDGVDTGGGVRSFVNFNDGPNQSFIQLGAGFNERLFNSQEFDPSFKFIVGGFRPVPELFIFGLIEYADSIDFANTRLGKSKTYEIEASYQFGRHLSAELEYRTQDFTVSSGALFQAKTTDLRATYQFNNRSFLRLTAQYSDVDRNLSAYINSANLNETNKEFATQLLYSYKINAQSRFFVGYSDAGFQDDQLNAIKKTNRTFFVKASYAWQQ